MANEADDAGQYIERGLSQAIENQRGDIPPGMPGLCCQCGEHFPRLVDGKCVPCRERLGE